MWSDWGGIGSRLGNSKKNAFPTLEKAQELIESIKKRREKRGYVMIGDKGAGVHGCVVR